MQSHMKLLLSFLNRSKIPLVLEFSIQLRVLWRPKDRVSSITPSIRRAQMHGSKTEECLLFVQKTKSCFLPKTVFLHLACLLCF